MIRKKLLIAVLLLILKQATAQSSLYFGAGPSINHITMDIAPASIPYFDVVHRFSVNAEVLYGYRFPNRLQLLAGAGMYSIKYGVEAGSNIYADKPSFPDKYFKRKNWMEFSTLTPIFFTAGGAYILISRPRFEVDASLMLDAVYLKNGNLLPLENTAKGTYYLFDQYTYNAGINLYLQPGLRLKRVTRHNFSY